MKNSGPALTVLDELKRGSLLALSLKGVRAVFEQEFGIKGIEIVTNDQAKQELLRRKMTSYPYGYFSITDVAPEKDRQNTKVIQRHGWRVGTTEATYSTTKKAYMFPLHVGIEMKYYESDPYQVLYLAEALSLLAGGNGFIFTIKIGPTFEFQVRLECPESVSIPLSEVDNAQQPGATELDLNFVMNTYGGFLRDTAAVNNTHPVADYGFAFSNNAGERTLTLVDEVRNETPIRY